MEILLRVLHEIIDHLSVHPSVKLDLHSKVDGTDSAADE